MESGLPIRLDEAGRLVCGPEVVIEEVKVRRFDELAPVALEPETCHGRQEPAYYMYNGVYRQADAGRLAGLGLRYELTLMPPLRMGRECVKTLGHRHCAEPRSGLDYAEVCEVLTGVAHFLFQTLDPSGPDASLAFYIEARAGDKVIIPPGLDHCTINPGPEPLLFSDVIAVGVNGIYDRFKAARGAAYLEVVQDGQACFIPNPAYRTVPHLQKVSPGDYPHLRLTRDEPLYTVFLEERGACWPFLADPSQFWAYFPDLATWLRS